MQSENQNISVPGGVATGNTIDAGIGDNSTNTSYQQTSQPISQENIPINDQKKENSALGMVGAIIGSLAGALTIILLSRLGFIASFSGIVMAACTMLLYEKFAKGMSIKGIVICVVVMLVMTLLAENVAISIKCVEELNELGYAADFGGVFTNLYGLMSADVIDAGAYAADLAMVYLFTIVGAAGVVMKWRSVIKNKMEG